MKVITLHFEELDKLTRELAREVMQRHSRPFDAVLSVLNGGRFVAESFMKHFPPENVRMYGEVALQRPFSAYKRGVLTNILPHLPVSWLNFMRRMEAKMLTGRRSASRDKVPYVELPQKVVSQLTSCEVPHILIIDDAIDTGKTLRAIVDAVLRANSQADVQVLAITVTTDAPQVMAHYYIYHDATLVRFPWSKDYKKKDEV